MKPRHIPAPLRRAVLDMDPAELAAELSKLPPNDQYVVAARLGAEISRARREHQEQMRDSGKEIAADPIWQRYDGGRGYGNSRVPRDELERRRSVPGLLIPSQRDEPPAWIPAADEDAGAARVRGR